MRYSYLFVYDADVGTREEVKAVLDAMPEVINWRYELPHSFFLVSEKSADALSTAFQTRNTDKGKHLIVAVTTNVQGLLTAKSWTLLNDKPDP